MIPPLKIPSHQEESSCPPQRSGTIALVIESLFLLAAVGILVAGSLDGQQERITTLSINFVALLLEAMPFMLLGAMAGGFIEVFIPRKWFDRLFKGRGKLAVLIGAGMGIVFPVCECVIVPVVRRLLGKGVPFSAAIAYLLGGPIVNTIVAGSTAVAYQYDWNMVLMRLVCGYIVAVTVAFIMGLLFDRQSGLILARTEKSTGSCSCGHVMEQDVTFTGKIRLAVRYGRDDFFEVGRYLVIGCFIASVLRSMISVNTFQSLAATPYLAILLMMGLAIILNLCSEADAFIAASFRNVLPGSAQMAFMVLGPMLDIKLILMYLTVFPRKVIITLSILTFSCVALLMLLLEFWGGF